MKLRAVQCRFITLSMIVTTLRNIVLIFVNDESQRLDTLCLVTEEFITRCNAKGIERELSRFLLQDQTVVQGEIVVVRAGNAIQKMPPQESRSCGASLRVRGI